MVAHTYAIVNVTDMTGTPSRWADVFEIAPTLKVDLDTGLTCIVKWDGDDPSWITSLGVTTYDHAGILAKMISDGTWNETDE